MESVRAAAARAERVQGAFSSETLRVYTTDDMLGAELAAALKNVIAIAVKIDAANNKLEPRAETLSNTLAVNNFQGVQVLLHAVRSKKNK